MGLESHTLDGGRSAQRGPGDWPWPPAPPRPAGEKRLNTIMIGYCSILPLFTSLPAPLGPLLDRSAGQVGRPPSMPALGPRPRQVPGRPRPLSLLEAISPTLIGLGKWGICRRRQGKKNFVRPTT